MSVVIVGTSAAAYAYYTKLNGNISRVPVFGAITTERPPKVADGAENILLVGSDSRNGATAAQLHAAGTTQDGGGVNTDTLILVHLAANGGPATLVSFPRDSWVAIPGHGHFKINAAYGDGEHDRKGGGPALLVETIESLTQQHIDHFLMVNFFQFIDISNAVGGVQVCLTKATKDAETGANFRAGVQTVQGNTALQFVRQRKADPGYPAPTDFGRINRQQRFISALVHKAKGTRNPATINAVLEQATKSLTVDDGLSGSGLVHLADRLKALASNNVRFATVPIANPDARHTLPDGEVASTVDLDLAKLPQFFDNVNHGRDPNYVPPAPVSTVPAVPATQIHVTVDNGSGVTGAAAKTRDALSSYGFTVDGIATGAPGSTVIRYGSGQAGAARTLAAAVPGALTREDDTLTSGSLVLVIGTDFRGVRNPSAAASAPAITSSAPAPANGSSSPAGSVPNAAIVSCGV